MEYVVLCLVAALCITIMWLLFATIDWFCTACESFIELVNTSIDAHIGDVTGESSCSKWDL